MDEQPSFVSDFADHLAGIEDRLDALRQSASPELRDIADGFRASYGADIWTHPYAYPIALLPAWLARGYGMWSAAHQARVADYAAAACAGYFYIRIQDDIYDEPTPVEPRRLLWGNILIAACLRGFARHMGGEPTFWRLASTVWREWTEATAFELRHGVRPLGSHPPQPIPSDLPFTELLEHVDPAVINGGRKLSLAKLPCFAVAIDAGREADIPVLEPALTALQAANQLLNDFCSLERDLQAGFVNFILSMALPAEFDMGSESRIRDGFRYLARSEAVEEALDLSRQLHQRAGAWLSQYGQPWLGEFVVWRIGLLDQLEEEFDQMRLEALLGLKE